ncbi:MAG: class I SAM-dependent methyltransferase [Patescibacteria group bacterium]|nr:class I SAM-dependent methyltransferase [Patescibacteria group bacterium]
MNESEYRIENEVQEKHWWYAGRRKLLSDSFEYLSGLEKGRPFKLAYDIGCGTVGNARCVKKYIDELIGIEPNAEACGLAKGHREYRDIINAGLEQARSDHALSQADVVIAMDVLEHLEDDEKGADVLGGLVRPGGYVVVTVPAFMSLWGFQDVVSKHFRRYRLGQLTRLLEERGFKILKKTYFNVALFPVIWAWRKLSRYWKPKNLESENQINSEFLNFLAKALFKLEIHLIKLGLYFPFGVSACVIAQKIN